MTKYSINKNIIGKHEIAYFLVYCEGDNIIIETYDKGDISKGVKL